MSASTRSRRQLWRVVDGAVADAISAHPNYFALGRQRSAQRSVVKRVVGAVNGYLRERASATKPRGRSGASSSGG